MEAIHLLFALNISSSGRYAKGLGEEHRYIFGLAVDYIAHLKAVGLSGNINTSFVECVNLTIRQ
jgi:hypothetical protein